VYDFMANHITRMIPSQQTVLNTYQGRNPAICVQRFLGSRLGA